MKKYISLLLTIFALFISCTGLSKKDTEIIILTTNDIHGHIDNFAKLAAYYEQMKEKHENVFLFNAGDMFSGNPLIDQYPEKGYPIIDIMNKTGYQLSTFGNHEFDYGQDILSDRIKQANFPFIMANAHVNGKLSHMPQFTPYHTFNINGIKMIVLSAIEVGSGGIPSTHPDRVKGISFYDPIEKMAKYKNLRKKCDIFIGLTHIGTDQDIKLAKTMPELDVILGGHSHTRIDTGMLVNGVLITQSDSWLKYIGQTNIIIKNGEIASKSYKLIDMKDLIIEDISIAKLIKEYEKKDPGNVIIGKTTTDISGKQALGALMTDAITESLGLDIALQNAGGIRISKLKAGDIVINDIYELDPFENEVIKINMTGKELKELIKTAFRKTKGNIYPDLLISGFTYDAKIKPDNGKTVSINMKDKNGKNIDMNRTYSVGMNSYIYTKYRFEHTDPGTSLHTTTAETLINFIKNKKIINEYGNIQRIKIEHEK